MLPLDAYLRERDRPSEHPAMYQKWRDLLFLHFPINPAELRPLVPQDLDIDTFPDADGNEQAWVGLVPFRMEGIRPRSFPALPWLSAFPETNVRTYVHRHGRPAVWFFSLDASQPLACAIARARFKLPYHEAVMTVLRNHDQIEYESRRIVNDARVSIRAELTGESTPATPGTLEFFLIERYLLFSTRNGQWFTGNVHHTPYPVRPATVEFVDETLVKASGIDSQPFIHAMFSDGVDVLVDRLTQDA